MTKGFKQIISIFILIIILIDLYTYKVVTLLSSNLPSIWDNSIRIFFISCTLLFIGIILTTAVLYTRNTKKLPYRFFFMLVGGFILIYIPKLVILAFHFTEDIIRLVIRIFSTGDSEIYFLTIIGCSVSLIPFAAICYGILFGRFNYYVKHSMPEFRKLPKSFNGFKIAHISDLHIGSYEGNKKKLAKAFRMINSLEADVILFSGDMVNTFSNEADSFLPLLTSLHARCGKFSVLGNHDYGEYYDWPDQNAKQENLDHLKDLYKDAGFSLLLNEHVYIDNDAEKICILGVENWGLPPFPAYGVLDNALNGTVPNDFKVLLSHDPTHFTEQILDKTSIDLTLSGHTHAMQFGFSVFGKKWSPVSLKYKYWDGLYKFGEQYLNVNRGLGFVGFPGRVGMHPEISLIELRACNDES